MRALVFAYGVAAYAAFLGTFLYLIGFVSGLVVPRSLDTAATAPMAEALSINTLLVALFGVQHAIMARRWFKARITRVIPKPAERSTFVLATCLVLGVLFWQWRPVGGVAWHVEAEWARGVVLAIAACGWLLVLYSTFLIDHFELFGLRQVWMFLRGKEDRGARFVARSAYKLVRHPLMLGFLIAFWAAPTMSVSHLMFAILLTAYVLIGIRIEERDLVRGLGQAYVDYRRRTPMLIPRLGRLPASKQARLAQS
jgi:protein-S-isoprenylcysteine O-methyltransferase Ste14